MNTENVISIWLKYNEYWKFDTFMGKKIYVIYVLQKYNEYTHYNGTE
jgi:hypothetical protein